MSRAAPLESGSYRELGKVSKPPVYVLGTGAVGVGLGRALRSAGYNLVGAWNRGEKRRQRAADLLGVSVATGPLPPEIGDAGLILVCVSDDAIAPVGTILADSGLVASGSVVAHTCGSRAADALGVIEGALLGSVHPLIAIPDSASADVLLAGATFAIEGVVPAAVRTLGDMVRALEGSFFEVSADAKPRYHAAAAMASNLVVALLGDAIGEAEAAGIEQAQRLMTRLAAGAIGQVAEKGAAGALTGPILRGDAETVRRHLDALGSDAGALYRAASARALELARQRGLPADQLDALELLLRKS